MTPPHSMEQLLHFAWQQRMFPLAPLTTTDGRNVEVINTGLYNTNEGPDFLNAKVRIGDTLWVGHVEIHTLSSDWHKHHHTEHEGYQNVVLHVVNKADCDVILNGMALPQLELPIPEDLSNRFEQLMTEIHYPPCHAIIPNIQGITVNQWLTQLMAERLESKMHRIEQYLATTCNDWEQTFFIALARNFGFGVNNDAFEHWAKVFPMHAFRKHSDDAFQAEALFFGMAGLLDKKRIDTDRQDAHFMALEKEFAFLKHKFGLTPIEGKEWKFLRLRPQNFPYTRLAQLLHLFQQKQLRFSQFLECTTLEEYKKLLHTQADSYWQYHYSFGGNATTPQLKQLQEGSLQLLFINTVAPLLYCYGTHHDAPQFCERAFELLEELPAENNHIVRTWNAVGITAKSAADSQALIQLRQNYCERKDCLRCKFGRFFLAKCKN